MNRLAFDTATAACMVALERVDGEVFETAPAPGRMFEQPAHTTELLPAIDGLLAQAGVGYAELGAVIVGTGPGAFTGLRIGVATARAIATARALPLIPVSSLAALIAGADAGDRPVFAVIDAKRREFFFRVDDQDRVGSAEDAAAAAAGLDSPFAIGDGAVKLAEQLTAAGAEVAGEGDARHLVGAKALLTLAAESQPRPVDDVVPNYIRPPDAKVSSRESWLATKVGA